MVSNVSRAGVIAACCWCASACGEARDSVLQEGVVAEEERELFPHEHSACTPSLRAIGDVSSTPSAVSASGETVVGTLAGNSQAFRFAGDELTLLEALPGASLSVATGVNATGSVISGSSSFEPTQAVIWRDDEITALGGLSETGDSSAADVSDDGKVAVGTAYNGTTFEAFRWSARTGTVGLGLFGGLASSASGVDRHGNVITGTVVREAAAEAYWWRRGGGARFLGFPDGFVGSTAEGLSPDGRVVVGFVDDGTQPFPARWSRKDGWLVLTDEPGIATGTNRDGSVVVGFTFESGRAIIWDEANGTRFVHDVLAQAGVSVDGWFLLETGDVSDDGKVVVGAGIAPSGDARGWIACLP